MMKNLIIIPTYNESENIINLLKEISNQCLKDTDILVVDDNSPDNTSQLVKSYITKNNLNNIFVLDRIEKEGLGKAYISGFKWAIAKKYDRLISMDADFSHHPKYLPKLISNSKYYDIVVGSRYVPGGKIIGWHPLRYLNSWGANVFTKIILGLIPNDVTAGFKCYKSSFIKSLDLDNLISSGYAFQVEMLNQAQEKNFSIIEIPIVFEDRQKGQSKISGELKRSALTVVKIALNKKNLKQNIKIVITFSLAIIIDLAFFNLFFFGFGLNVFLSRILSFSFATINSYILNKKYSLKKQHKLIRFINISTISLILNLIMMRLFNITFNFQDEICKNNVSVLIAIALVTVSNYIIYKREKIL